MTANRPFFVVSPLQPSLFDPLRCWGTGPFRSADLGQWSLLDFSVVRFDGLPGRSGGASIGHAQRPTKRKIPMRILALAILTIATVSAAPSARAQTYDPAYPVCLQIYQSWNDYYFECAYTCCLSATRRHRAAPPSAWSIRIMRNPIRAKKGPTSNGKPHA